jgi:hypothetical protein
VHSKESSDGFRDNEMCQINNSIMSEHVSEAIRFMILNCLSYQTLCFLSSCKLCCFSVWILVEIH